VQLLNLKLLMLGLQSLQFLDLRWIRESTRRLYGFGDL
jgi:hypothetical protein